MSDPLSIQRIGGVGGLQPARPASSTDSPAGGFASELRQQLERVSQIQNDAEQNVQNLVTGQTDNITEVFTAARKAEVAFSLLMELRNKLADAYTELRQLRV